MANILVTGGTGFIGRHLVQRLVERGDQVRCLIRDRSRQQDLAQPGVEFLHGDVSLTTPLDEAVRLVFRRYQPHCR